LVLKFVWRIIYSDSLRRLTPWISYYRGEKFSLAAQP